MVKFYDGDLFEAPVKIICHQCNCQNTMGGGIAKKIRERFPDAWKADCDAFWAKTNKLGNISVGKDIKYRIVNIYGQDRYGRDKRYTNYEALHSGLEKTIEFAESLGSPPIGFPWKMGCSLAGGDFRIVSKMIEVVFENYKNDVLICKYIP